MTDADIYNTYGPSETTVCATYFRLNDRDPLDNGTYPIGHPVEGTHVEVLDEDLRPVHRGAPGEICIMGDGVSDAYLRDVPEQVNFVTLPDGRRMYRSGDLGYVLPDGNFGFLHRKDKQVMIMGKRVECDEVENILNALVRWRMEVLRCVFADADSPDWDALEEAGREYYSRHNPPDDNVTVIASVNGMDAGCGALCMQEEMPSPDNTSGRCAYLMSIYVRDAFRRRGIGGAIVNRLINEARNRLAGKIYLETSSMGEPLYLHAGFEPMEDMLKLKH